MKNQDKQVCLKPDSVIKTQDTAQELQDKRNALDYEIRVNIAFAFEQFGQQGVDRLAAESARFAEILRKGEIGQVDFTIDDRQSSTW